MAAEKLSSICNTDKNKMRALENRLVLAALNRGDTRAALALVTLALSAQSDKDNDRK